MAMGSNQAHSINTFLVEKEISVSAPPMMPPMPTMREPSPSQITQVPESSWRSTPSRVLIFSPAALGALEERGFDSVWAAEHSHIPVPRKTPAPGGGELHKRYYDVMDPFVTLTAAACEGSPRCPRLINI